MGKLPPMWAGRGLSGVDGANAVIKGQMGQMEPSGGRRMLGVLENADSFEADAARRSTYASGR